MSHTDDQGRSERHNARMARKKAIMDARIAAADEHRGVFIVNAGNGKGKSSSGLGMVMRALGHDMQVGVVQFIKGAMETGEERFLRRFPEQVQFHAMGEGYTWNTQDRDRDMARAAEAWAKAREMLQDPAIGLVLLDELNIALKYKYLDVDQVLDDILARPLHQHVIITGRGVPDAVVEAADTVTDMTLVKHAFAAGIAAQPGVEW